MVFVYIIEFLFLTLFSPTRAQNVPKLPSNMSTMALYSNRVVKGSETKCIWAGSGYEAIFMGNAKSLESEKF